MAKNFSGRPIPAKATTGWCRSAAAASFGSRVADNTGMAADNAALMQGLKDGVFDLIATDHAPHTEFEKAQDFVTAPNGITGLDMALVVLFHNCIAKGEFGWDLLVKRYSAEPRRFMGLEPVPVEEGKRSELILFDPNGETTFTREFMQSKSSNTPVLDQTLKGRVEMVVMGDEILLER